MRNQELIEYYQNVVKAEDLAYFIDRAKAQAEVALAGIKNQKMCDKSKGDTWDSNFINIDPPVLKKAQVPQKRSVWQKEVGKGEDVSEAIGGFAGVLIALLLFFFDDSKINVVLKAILSGVLGYIGFWVITFIVILLELISDAAKKRKAKKIYDKEVKAAESEYQQKCRQMELENQRYQSEYEAEYRNLMMQIEQYNRIAEQRRNDLRIEISHLDSEAKEVAKRLDSLYAIPRVPMHMRGLVASHNMLQYLETGYQMLEGPGGTYEQYYKDLRTDRITDNLTKIEQAVRAGTSDIVRSQARLCAAIRGVGDKVGSFASSMSEEMGRLSSMTSNVAGSVQGLSSSVRDFNASTQSQLGKLSAMNQTMEWNQYITAEKLGIDRSLLRKP